MRKLNKKNKIYILALSIFVLLVLILAILFIVYKIKDLNVKYNVVSGSITYTAKKELIKVKKDTYAKKNIMGNYYVVMDDKKVPLGDSPVIYDSYNDNILMLGTYFEVLKNGEVDKLKGATQITGISKSRLFKIADRRYLVVAPKIISSDGSLDARNYLLVNIDKKGNAYLYNNDNNIKTFSELELITPDFTFKVSEEVLVRDDEEIDLAKINGSTNEYVPSDEPGEGDGTGEGDGNGDGEGNGAGEGEGEGEGSGMGSGQLPGESIYPPGSQTVVITDTVTVEKYVQRKTSIIGLEATESSIKVNYIVYDPFDEFKNLYVEVASDGQVVGTYNLDLGLTSYTLTGLKANTTYDFKFYYTYEDSDGNTQNVLFDNMVCTTKSIIGHLTLEKTTANSVRYLVKIDGGYELERAVVNLFVDGELVGSKEVNTLEAASKTGYTGEINFDAKGEFAILQLTDCIYNGEVTGTSASYKYKL